MIRKFLNISCMSKDMATVDRELESQRAVCLARHGQPHSMLVSLEEYEQMQSDVVTLRATLDELQAMKQENSLLLEVVEVEREYRNGKGSRLLCHYRRT